MEVDPQQPAARTEPTLPAEGSASSAPLQAAPSAASTGLTPDQVFQEFKKSGFLDQLRRQMFDAYVSSTAAPPAPIVPSVPADSATGTAEVTQPAAAPTTATNSSATSMIIPQPPTSAVADAATPVASTQHKSELGSKQDLTSYLDTILRPQLEKEHDRLRFQDPRNQLDTLLKFLDSEPVASAEGHGQDATLYEQLTAHVAKKAPSLQNTATNGMLNKEGRIGKEVSQRISELIADLGNPGAKTGDDEEDDEDNGDKPLDNNQQNNDATDMEV